MLLELFAQGEVAEWLKAATCKGRYTVKAVSEVRILPLSAIGQESGKDTQKRIVYSRMVKL